MYGIKSVHDAAVEAAAGDNADGEDDEDDDIEASIKKELASLNAKGAAGSATADGTGQNLRPIKMNVDCLLFVKTQPPIEPVAFVRRICEDAKTLADSGQMRCRYVNRLTPVTVMGKATEQGLVEVARRAMGEFFDLGGKQEGEGETVSGESGEGERKEEGGCSEKEVGKEADEKVENAGSNEAAEPEKKPFTVRPNITYTSSPLKLNPRTVCHPTEHPQSRQVEERRRD